jgi:predicted Rossmann fold flavoprotein
VDVVDVIVVGGGAAGFFGAIACAENQTRLRVTLLEKSRQALAKVKISGGGRCNVTHACFDPRALVLHYPRGQEALRGPFSRFQPRDTVDWFASRGVPLKTEPDGRMFPVTDSSQTVVDCLEREAQRTGVRMRTGCDILSIERAPDGFLIRLAAGETVACKRLLLATGSNRRAWEWAVSLGHSLSPPVPSLFTFNLADKELKRLAGISVEETSVAVEGARLKQQGPLLITHWGLSGPAVLKLSAWGARILHEMNYQFTLRVNWAAALEPSELRRRLAAEKSGAAGRAVASSGSFLSLPRRLWEYLLLSAGLSPQRRWAEVKSAEIEALARTLEAGSYPVDGKSTFKEEFVTCGGVRLEEVDFKSMESRKCPGLFFAGEVLDVDGVTGGFNFQAAWTTGWLAGRSMGALTGAPAAGPP